MRVMPAAHSPRKGLRARHLAAVGGEAGSEGCEPKVLVVVVSCESSLKREENAGATYVAVVGENVAGLGEVAVGELSFKRQDDIASAGMGKDLIGIGRAFIKEVSHCFRREFGDAAVEFVAEVAVVVDEANFFTFAGVVQGVEVVSAPASGVVGSGFPDACACAVAEEAKTDEDAGIVGTEEGR